MHLIKKNCNPFFQHYPNESESYEYAWFCSSIYPIVNHQIGRQTEDLFSFIDCDEHLLLWLELVNRFFFNILN